MFGFLVSSNQFNVLQASESAVSTSRSQIEDKLVDPRKTRLARLQSARRTDEYGTFGNLSNEENFHTVPPVHDEQGIYIVEELINLFHLKFVIHSFLILYLSLH